MSAHLAPVDAIDPDAAYERWKERYLWHAQQIPHVIDYEGGSVIVSIARLKASRFDQVRVSGGGYIDNLPVADGPGSRDNAAIWNALRTYLTCAAGHLGMESPVLPPAIPAELALAREWAYAVSGWLVEAVEFIGAWPDLDQYEDGLFRLIRRARRRQGDQVTTVAAPELCLVCGERAVRVDWLDGAGGTPVLTKACAVCGHTLTEQSSEGH